MDTNSVYVYGFKCPIRKVSLGYSVTMILEDLEATHKGDTIRIMSGEANADLYNQVEQVLKKHCIEKKLEFEMIAGPILSVSRHDGQTKNAVIDLAKAGFLDLYESKIRRELHFRIVENRILRGELPHAPADYSRRQGFTINVDKLQEEEKESALFAIENRIKDFEAAKAFCEYISPEDVEERFVLLTNEKIHLLNKKAAEEGLNIDSFPRDQILRMSRNL